MTSPFRRILVPHDLSNGANDALRLARKMASDGGRITVLHVIGTYYPINELPVGGASRWTPPTEMVDATRRELERAVRSILGRDPGFRVDTQVELGDPFEQIMTAAEKADVVVMGTAGRTGLSRLVIGSIAEKIVRHCPAPVLTVRPTARKTLRSAHPRSAA